MPGTGFPERAAALPDAEAARARPAGLWRVAVRSVADLRAVEEQLRVLYRTTPGHTCQALLTTEFQTWKRNVSLELSATRGRDGTRRLCAPCHGEQRAKVRTIEAFLPQFHIMYACDSVDIYHIVPLVALHHGEKRARSGGGAAHSP